MMQQRSSYSIPSIREVAAVGPRGSYLGIRSDARARVRTAGVDKTKAEPPGSRNAEDETTKQVKIKAKVDSAL